MKHLKLLTLTTCLIIGSVSSIPTNVDERARQTFHHEPIMTSDFEASEPSKPKVIIRPVSFLTTPPPTAGDKQTNNNENNGCQCESLDACPVELMDFSFAVSCEYGTVRCCRPLEQVVVKEPTTTEPAVVFPSTTPRRIKKPIMCKCKPQKECDRFFQNVDEPIDRKDEMSCPAGSVRCCENGNMGNPKVIGIPLNPATHILGGNDFRPVQLPFLKMPSTTNQRISEHEPLPASQEIDSMEVNPEPPVKAVIANPSLQAFLAAPTTEIVETTIRQVTTPRTIPTPPQVVPQSQFRPSPPVQPVQHQPIGGPIRQTGVFTNGNPNNFPIRVHPGPPSGFQFQQPQPVRTGPFMPQNQQPIPIGIPFRQPISGPIPGQFPQPHFQSSVPGAQFQSSVPGAHSTLTQQAAEQSFNFAPSFPFNQPVPGLAPPPQRRPAPMSPTVLQPPRPTQQQGGGFFSSLMSMFGGGN